MEVVLLVPNNLSEEGKLENEKLGFSLPDIRRVGRFAKCKRPLTGLNRARTGSMTTQTRVVPGSRASFRDFPGSGEFKHAVIVVIFHREIFVVPSTAAVFFAPFV